MDKSYLQIVDHYESCLEKHGDSHLGVDWPRQKDVEVRYHVMLDLFQSDPASELTLLDFGCGLSHLQTYMQRGDYGRVRYAGLDLSERFIRAAQEKFPDTPYYCLDILKDGGQLPSFDYIVMNGVFTQKCSLSFDAMFAFAQRLVKQVFSKCTKGIAFNVMSDQVDWKRDGSFHVPFDQLATFLTKEVSRDFVFRHNYGLYEYTTYVYRTPSIALE